MPHTYLLFGDNIWESKAVMEKIREHCLTDELFSKIELGGCPALPIYTLHHKDIVFQVECRGNYNQWNDLPSKVHKYISFFDKPDAVLFDEENNKIIAAGEFTETVSVGNSQWQRSGRAVASAKLDVPFLAVYPCVAEDRSQDTLREPTALLTEFFLKLSLEDLDSPTLLLLREDPYLYEYNIERRKIGLPVLNKPEGDYYIGRWFGLRLLSSKDKSMRKYLIKLEREIYTQMFHTLYEHVLYYGKETTRVEKDLPLWGSKFENPTDIASIRKHTLRELSGIIWLGIQGKQASNSYFNKVVCPQLLSKTTPKTYVRGGKHCIISSDFTKETEKILLEKYPPHEGHKWKLGKLNYSLPTSLIPLQVWQRDGEAYSDPNAGEAVAFPAMFDSLDKKQTNIIFIAYGKPSINWYSDFSRGGRKVWRAMKKLGDILCVDNDNDPISISLR